MPSLMAPPKVTLTPQELNQASFLGLSRQYKAMTSQNRDSVWEKPYHESLSAHVVGAMGEMAVAKWLGIWYSFSEGTYKTDTDLSGDLEVRTRTNTDWSLLVRPQDKDESKFVLVTTSDGNSLILHGWISGAEAKKDEWVRDWGNRGRPVFSVPQEALKEMQELRSIYRD